MSKYTCGQIGSGISIKKYSNLAVIRRVLRIMLTRIINKLPLLYPLWPKIAVNYFLSKYHTVKAEGLLRV